MLGSEGGKLKFIEEKLPILTKAEYTKILLRKLY